MSDTGENTMSLTIESMLSTSRTYDERKVDFKENVENIDIDEEARVVTTGQLFGQQNPMPIESRAMNQLCQKLGPPRARYIKQCPPWLQSSNLNHWLDVYRKESRNGNGEWFLRTIDGNVRAFLSQHYSILNNTEVLEIVRDILDEGGIGDYELLRSYLDPDQLHLKLRVRRFDVNLDDSTYGVGFYVRNGETGNYGYTVAPCLWRGACDNTIEFLKGAYRKAHYRIDPHLLKIEGVSAMGDALSYGVDMIHNVVDAQTRDLPNLGEIVGRILKERNLPQDAEPHIHAGTERQNTVMGLVNGLSYAAHATKGLDMDTQIQFEGLAGAILAQPDDLFGVIGRSLEPAETEMSVAETEAAL